MPCGLEGNCRSGVAFKGVRRILVRGSMSPCAWGEENFENLTTKWCIHFEVYLNKYMVSIAPFSTPAFTPPPVRKLLFFACFRFLIFHPFFQGGQLTPFAPMCGRPWSHWPYASRTLVVYPSFHLRLHGLRTGDEHTACTPDWIWHTLPYLYVPTD